MQDSEPRVSGDLAARIGSGDRRVALEAIRDELAKALDTASVGVKAQIAAQLRACLSDIAALPDSKKVTKADELTRRREARRAAALAPAPAAGEGN